MGLQFCTGVPHAQSLSHVRLFVSPWTVATRLLCWWNFPGKNTGVGCQFLLQMIFTIQGSNKHLLHLPHWQVDSLSLTPPGKPQVLTPECGYNADAALNMPAHLENSAVATGLEKVSFHSNPKER